MIGRGWWTRFVLRHFYSSRIAEIASTPPVLRRVRQRILHDHDPERKPIEEEPLFVGTAVSWSRRCTCGTLMRSTSTEERCWICRERAAKRAEDEARVAAIHERRILYMERR